jgi:hypothetical protein
MEEIDRDAPRRAESADRAERETRQRQGAAAKPAAAGAAKPAVDMADVEKNIDKILEGKIV